MRGFSLVELMVASALVGIVAGGLMLATLSQTSGYRHAWNVGVAQDTLRLALRRIIRDVRAASATSRTGTVTLGSGTVDVNGAPASQVPTVWVTNSSSGPDRLDIIYGHYNDGATAAILLAPLTAGATNAMVSSDTNFGPGRYLMISDYTNAMLLPLTRAATWGTVNGVAAASVGDFSITNPIPSGQYQAGAIAALGESRSLRVAPGYFGKDTPALVLGGGLFGGGEEPLAEGVEDLQIAVGIDGLNGQPADGVITEVGAGPNDDEWVYNVAGDSPPPLSATVAAVRVTLVARTHSAEPGTAPARPDAEDRPAGTPDGFRRRTVRTLITVRNNMPVVP